MGLRSSETPALSTSGDTSMRDVSVKREESPDHYTTMDTDWSMYNPSPQPEWSLRADTGNVDVEDSTLIKEEEASVTDMAKEDGTQASLTPTLPLSRSTVLTQRPPGTSHATGTSALVSEFAALDVNKSPAAADESSTTDSSFTDACSALTVVPASTTRSTLAAVKRELSSARLAKPHPTTTKTMDSSRIPTYYMITPIFVTAGQTEQEHGQGEPMTRDEYLTHLQKYVLILLFAHFAKIL